MPHSNSQLRTDLLREARTWIGTKWIRNHHLKGYGCDCIGLVVECFRAIGACPDFVYPPYGLSPKPEVIRAQMAPYLTEIPASEMLPGDVAFLLVREYPMHLAIIGDLHEHGAMSAPFSLIHAALNYKKVVEEQFTPAWHARVASVHRWPGFEGAV